MRLVVVTTAVLSLPFASACGKSDSRSSPESARTEADRAETGKPDGSPFANARGFVITRTDVFLDGDKLAGAPSNMFKDGLDAIHAKMLEHAPRDLLRLSYTDDAPANFVLAALHEVSRDPAPSLPPPEAAADDTSESGGSGTAMALDEGKMGRKEGTYRMKKPDDRDHVEITALVAGKPTMLCAATAGPIVDSASETVALTLLIGHDGVTRALTRVNEQKVLATRAELEHDLADQKKSAVFSDRDDVVLIARDGSTGADLTPVIDAACKAGFRAISVAPEKSAFDDLSKTTSTSPGVLSLGQPNIVGSLDKAIVRRYLKRKAAEITTCYTKVQDKTPTLEGTVALQFAISADGVVVSSSAKGVDDAVASCVARTVKEIMFPKPKSGGVQVNYPVTFHPPRSK